jgi:hypothetical protein
MSTDTKTIELDGDTWRVVGLGVRRDGQVYAHLASTTRFRQQRNGKCPIQMCDFIDEKLVA